LPVQSFGTSAKTGSILESLDIPQNEVLESYRLGGNDLIDQPAEIRRTQNWARLDRRIDSSADTMAIDALTTRNLCGEFAGPNCVSERIRDFTYQFRPGSFYHLSGPEFGGKRLLLQMLGLMLPPESGDIIVDGSLVTDLDIDDLSDIRNRKYGFLFSSPLLLPAFTVLENVAMPLFKITQVEAAEAKLITDEILEIVGISGFAGTSVEHLELFHEMLTALARALVHHPRILIAESVGTNMQAAEADTFLNTLRVSSQRLGLTVIATFAPHVSWGLADIRLEIGEEGVEVFERGDPHG
jgi:ABC-type lipoprotein export system ATPase subunit